MQRAAFQQGANNAHGKTITCADRIDHVVDFYRCHAALFAAGGFVPSAISPSFDDHGLHPVAQIKVGDGFRRLLTG